VIAVYLESIENGRRFYEACRSTSKPIVVLKSGRTKTGARAAMSHTASLAQDDRVVDGALRQAGVIRVYDMNDLMTIARCLGVTRVEAKSGGRVAVMAFSGGAGVVAADSLTDAGIELARLAGPSLQRIKEVFPEWMEPANPLDLYPATERNGVEKVFPHCLDALLNDPEVDAIFLHIFGWFPPEAFAGFERIAELSRQKQKPIVAWTMGDPESCGRLAQHLEGMGIPAVEEISKGVRVLSAMTRRR
jgi:acetyltransferase